MSAVKSKGTVEWVAESGLCTGCGSCAGICPQHAVEMRIDESRGIYIPRIDQEGCNRCGICLEVCPGHAVDFQQLNLDIFGREPEDVMLGNFLGCYLGHANNPEIRYKSASGGLVTALLVFALEEGLIDGVLVTRMSGSNPFEPQSFVARTKEEIISAARSKYCPVSANTALKAILSDKGRFAVVGLPCHIHGIRKAEMLNKELKQKIALHLGIFCSASLNFSATSYILQRFGIKKKEVVKIDYRGEGYPGAMSVRLRDGSKSYIPYATYSNMLRSFFIPPRCLLCSDFACDLADISFGDVPLFEVDDEETGISTVIVRSESGHNLIRRAIADKHIELRGLPAERLLLHQRVKLLKKKCYLKANLPLFKFFGRKVPIYHQTFKEPTFSGRLRSVSYILAAYIQIHILSKRCLWRLLPAVGFLLSKATGLWAGKSKRHS